MKNMILGAGATLALLALAGSVQAQRIGGSSGGSSGSSSFGSSGSSSFGSSGSSSFGSSGGTFGGSGGSSFGSSGSSGGGFTGGSAGGGRATGGATGGTAYSSGSPFAAYNGNPFMGGIVNSSSTGGASGTNSRYSPLYASPVAFGTPAYNNTASVGSTGNQGVTSALGGGRAGQTGTGTSALYRGATSAGIRRAPSMVTETVFDRAPPRPMEAVRAHVISTVANASRLPSRDRIRVTMDGGAVYLRGQVRNARERRLAEAIVRMTPGIRDVRNELIPDTK